MFSIYSFVLVLASLFDICVWFSGMAIVFKGTLTVLLFTLIGAFLIFTDTKAQLQNRITFRVLCYISLCEIIACCVVFSEWICLAAGGLLFALILAYDVYHGKKFRLQKEGPVISLNLNCIVSFDK